MSSIGQLSKEMGIAYSKVPLDKEQKTYDIDHTGTIMLVSPKVNYWHFYFSSSWFNYCQRIYANYFFSVNKFYLRVR